jgi:anti-sigma factor RsiW
MKTFSDEQIKAYFLGKLSVPEAEVFEEDAAQSAELTEYAQLVERELTDDFLRGALTAEEARLFEESYLVTEARRRRFRTAKILWQTAGKQSSAVAAGTRKNFWQSLFGGPRIFQFAAGGLLLLLVFAAVFYYFSKKSVSRNEIAEIKVAEPRVKIEDPVAPASSAEDQNQNAQVASPAVRDSREINKNTSFAPKSQTEPKPAESPQNTPQSSTSLAVFTLFAGTLRDEGEQFISLLQETKKVGLRLKLPEDAGKYQIYRILLKPVEGDTIFSAQNLRSLNFTIPAEKLENRTYVVFLEGKNAENVFESIAEYSFRVRR